MPLFSSPECLPCRVDRQPAARSACPYQAQVLTYNPRGWQPLARCPGSQPDAVRPVLHRVAADQRQDHPTRAQHRPGGAEQKARTSTRWPSSAGRSGPGKPGSWYSKGVAFRRKMAAAGYDPARGETWAINELPSTIRSRADTRAAGPRPDSRPLHRATRLGAFGRSRLHRRRRAVDAELRAVQGIAARLAAGRGVLDRDLAPRHLVGAGDLRQLLPRVRPRTGADRGALDRDQRLLAAHREARVRRPAGHGRGARVLRPGLDSRADGLLA